MILSRINGNIEYSAKEDITGKVILFWKYNPNYMKRIKRTISASLLNKLKYGIRFFKMELQCLTHSELRNCRLVRLSREFIYISFLDAERDYRQFEIPPPLNTNGCISLKYYYDKKRYYDDNHQNGSFDDYQYGDDECYYFFQRGIFINNDFTGHMIISDSYIRNYSDISLKSINLKYVSKSLPIHNYCIDKIAQPTTSKVLIYCVKYDYIPSSSGFGYTKISMGETFTLSKKEYNLLQY